MTYTFEAERNRVLGSEHYSDNASSGSLEIIMRNFSKYLYVNSCPFLIVVACVVLFMWQTLQQGLTERERLLDRNLLFSKSSLDVRQSKLHRFDVRDLVALFDELALRKAAKTNRPPGEPDHVELCRYNETKRFEPRGTLHVAFVGDSRIRQLFGMLFKTLPPSDLSVYPAGVELTADLFIPRQMIAYSELLRTVVSYNWYNLLVERNGEDVFEFFERWLVGPNSNEQHYFRDPNATLIDTPYPDVLVIGIELHHMIKRHRADKDLYFKKLREFVPLLRNMSKYCEIVWLNQYPTIEFFGEINNSNSEIHSEKIWHYNQLASSVLKNSGIHVWSSGCPIVEEYIRSCLLNNRKDGEQRGFFSCTDFIHPGTSTIADMVQILYNFLIPAQ